MYVPTSILLFAQHAVDFSMLLVHLSFSLVLIFYPSREFNHRVKSISMATFKPEEVKALQAGGNAV